MNKFIRWWKSDKFFNTFKIVWVIYLIAVVIQTIIEWVNGNTSNLNINMLAVLFSIVVLQYIGMITNRNKEIKKLKTEISSLKDAIDEIAYRVYR